MDAVVPLRGGRDDFVLFMRRPSADGRTKSLWEGMRPGLYIVGTPIGNLQDISPRAVATLQAADMILAEDTRHTQRLLAHWRIDGRLTSCHRFNENSRAHLVLRQVRAGQVVALVSSAGMPGISDPGARLARACRQAGVYVTVVPGPSAVTAALSLSGFAGGGFVMQGFLPRKPGARRRRLAELLGPDMPVVVFESPYRLLKLLEELECLTPARMLCVVREITKLNEECRWGTAAELAGLFGGRAVNGRIRGEYVVIIAPQGVESAAGPDDRNP